MYKLIEAPYRFSSHILAIDDIGKVLSQTMFKPYFVVSMWMDHLNIDRTI